MEKWIQVKTSTAMLGLAQQFRTHFDNKVQNAYIKNTVPALALKYVLGKLPSSHVSVTTSHTHSLFQWPSCQIVWQ